MRVEQEFFIQRSPEAVFDHITDPSKLASWQTSKTSVEQIGDDPPGRGTRVRERTKGPGGREFEQVVEFTEFDRPTRFRVEIVEGPYPVDGEWALESEGEGTRVRFSAEGELTGLMRLLGPLTKRMVGRQFAGYHENLRRNLEA